MSHKAQFFTDGAKIGERRQILTTLNKQHHSGQVNHIVTSSPAT